MLITARRLGQCVQDILHLTADIIRDFGARPAGSDSCFRAAHRLRQEFGKHCDTAVLDEFQHHPAAFLGYLRIVAALYILASLLLYFNCPVLALAAYGAGHVITLAEFGFYREFIDRLFPEKRGYNVVGRLEPEAESRRQILLSAHHDSAYEFTYLSYTPHLYLFLIYASTTANVLVPAGLLAWIIGRALGLQPLFSYAILQAASFLTVVLNTPFFFFLKKKATPGAGDNLVASCLLVKVAELLRAKKQEQAGLRHTRVLFVSYDAEEAGLRGSRAFARQHRRELLAVPAFGLNLESLFDVRDLKFLLSDINGTVPLSRPLAENCRRIASKLGYETKLLPMIYGYGGTDAAETAKIGVPSASLVGLNPDFSSGRVHYHTQNDSVENLQPEAIRAALEIVLAFISEEDALPT